MCFHCPGRLRRNASTAFFRACSTLLVATPMALLCLLVLTLPMCELVKQAAESMLRADVAPGFVWNVPLTVFEWPPGFRQGVPDVRLLVAINFVREFVFTNITVICSNMVCYTACSPGDYASRRRYIGFCALLSVFLLAVRGGAAMAQAHGLIDITAPQATLLRVITGGIVWAPSVTALLCMPFEPEQRSRAVVGWAAGLSFGWVASYNLWLFVCSTYFSVQSTLMRVLVGVCGLNLCRMISFEAAAQFSFKLLALRNFKSAVLLLSIPMGFGFSIGSVMQLGAQDYLSGVLLELVSAACELSFKMCLLAGHTPVESTWIWGRRLVSRACCASTRKRMTAVVDIDAVVPGLSEGRCVQDDMIASTASQHAQNERKRLLTAMTLDAEVMELVVQALVAGFYICAKINPNEPSAPPTSQTRVITLLFVKVAIELVTDCAMCVFAFQYLPDQGTEFQAQATKHWDRERLHQLLLMCMFAALFSTDAQTFSGMFLCPTPVADSIDVASRDLLSVSVCPSA
mmetsp:Transcript_103304/g.289445  ORF Transcript_103304/g.289445 Transcript_103304/m.289445 type:complete len:516 (+) Transcript_103304:69-1616(+)